MKIDYGTEARKEWFERVFWCDTDYQHSAFQAFVNGKMAGGDELQAFRDWIMFRDGWNARDAVRFW